MSPFPYTSDSLLAITYSFSVRCALISQKDTVLRVFFVRFITTADNCSVIGRFGFGDDSSMAPEVGKKPSAAVVCSAILHRMGAEGLSEALIGLVDLSDTYPD